MFVKFLVILAATLGILALLTKFPVPALSHTAFVVPTTSLAVSYGFLALCVLWGLMWNKLSLK